jgi:hypothetical protein
MVRDVGDVSLFFSFSGSNTQCVNYSRTYEKGRVSERGGYAMGSMKKGRVRWNKEWISHKKSITQRHRGKRAAAWIDGHMWMDRW